MQFDDVTVLVPLHRSARFVDVVEGNVRRIASDCHMIVSDAAGEDDTLSRLRERCGDVDTIEWVEPRSLPSGWVAHYNDLLERATSAFFMWLPHDDEIDLAYVARCREAVRDGVVGASGVIDSVPGEDFVEVPQGPLDAIDRNRPYHSEANRLLFDWNLGISFRSIFRRAAVRPILDTDPTSSWADLVWTYGVSLDGELVQIPNASYRKRWYATSTHADWGSEPFPKTLPYLLREIERRELDDADVIAAELIDHATRRAVDRVNALEHAVAQLRSESADHVALRSDLEAALARYEGELAETRASLATAVDQLGDVHRSWSWRIGQVAVAPVRVLRRLRSARSRRRAARGSRGSPRRGGS